MKVLYEQSVAAEYHDRKMTGMQALERFAKENNRILQSLGDCLFGLAVNTAGEVYRVTSSTPFARITGEFIEPKPPTPIERLERWHAGYMKNNGYAETLESIIADLKAEAAK